jgi:alpha-beta hydrolase superfamily lysophospholipase
VIAIPGTQVWAPRTGPNPLDVTSAVRSMAGRQNAAVAAVVEAMRTAGVRPGEPVCLVGHSLGGMVAAGLAADPALRQRYRITEVVTLGSPVATYPVLRDVGVLALEHTDDLVPKLDGAINPDRTRWVTVRHQVTPSGVTPDVVVTHDVSTYVRTAALLDTSPDPALIGVRSRLAPFLAAPGRTATVVDVTARRDLR